MSELYMTLGGDLDSILGGIFNDNDNDNDNDDDNDDGDGNNGNNDNDDDGNNYGGGNNNDDGNIISEIKAGSNNYNVTELLNNIKDDNIDSTSYDGGFFEADVLTVDDVLENKSGGTIEIIPVDEYEGGFFESDSEDDYESDDDSTQNSAIGGTDKKKGDNNVLNENIDIKTELKQLAEELIQSIREL